MKKKIEKKMSIAFILMALINMAFLVILFIIFSSIRLSLLTKLIIRILMSLTLIPYLYSIYTWHLTKKNHQDPFQLLIHIGHLVLYSIFSILLSMMI
ncbi:hypothetical protein [Acholeplasma hippikon]|uniref:Uncharacterized protein n=1 Tax=Acholeplasma hippikon TaxID=264636 RepID=A0A449BJD4_9MOLU|nr:hypothetical protein [Acholeplasma hippikon]VEU82548.1 Uncharacterised protein [Acholeplasma hippikon]